MHVTVEVIFDVDLRDADEIADFADEILDDLGAAMIIADPARGHVEALIGVEAPTVAEAQAVAIGRVEAVTGKPARVV